MVKTPSKVDVYYPEFIDFCRARVVGGASPLAPEQTSKRHRRTSGFDAVDIGEKANQSLKPRLGSF